MEKQRLIMLAAKFKTLGGAQKRAAFASVHNTRGYVWFASALKDSKPVEYRVCRFTKGE